MITIATFCRCGAELKVSSSSWQAVTDIDSMFGELHTGDGHGLFPTAAERDTATLGLSDEDVMEIELDVEHKQNEEAATWTEER